MFGTDAINPSKLPPLLPDDYLRKIGEVVVRFQQTEFMLSAFVWTMLGLKRDVGQMVTGQLSHRGLWNLAEKLLRQRYPGDTTHQAHFATLLKASFALEERRNQIVHSYWMTRVDNGNPSAQKISRKTLKFTGKDLPLSELESLSEDLRRQSGKLARLFVDVHGMVEGMEIRLE